MDWNSVAYSRTTSRLGRRLIRDRRTKPLHVSWSHHAFMRASERAEWTPQQCRLWFQGARYLGRWARNEHWGDEDWVIGGIRDKKKHGRFTIITFMPRAYWDHDVVRYDKMMQDLEIRDHQGAVQHGQEENHLHS